MKDDVEGPEREQDGQALGMAKEVRVPDRDGMSVRLSVHERVGGVAGFPGAITGYNRATHKKPNEERP